MLNSLSQTIKLTLFPRLFTVPLTPLPHLKSALAVLLATLLNGCNPVPDCPMEIHSPPALSAGCLVIENQQLLVAKAHNGLVSIPGGSGNTNEPSHCTAHRETWEETGLDTRPKKLMRVFDNGFHLYRCRWSGTQQVQNSVPFFLEIDQVFWIEEEDFDHHKWRFPEQADWLREQLRLEQE